MKKSFAALLTAAALASGCEWGEGRIRGDDGGRVVGGTRTFSLKVSDLSVAQGGSRAVALSVTRIAGFAEPVSLTLEGAVEGIAGELTPNPVTEDSGTVLLRTAAATDAKSYILTVRGKGGGVEKSVQLKLTVVPNGGNGADFDLALNPTSITVRRGAGSGIHVNIIRRPDFAGEVTVSASALPSGVTAAPLIIAGDSSDGTLELTAGGMATLGAKAIIVSAAAEGFSQSATVNLTVAPEQAQGILHLRASLSKNNVRPEPPAFSGGYGSATATLDGNFLEVQGSFADLAQPCYRVSLHGPAGAEENVGVIRQLSFEGEQHGSFWFTGELTSEEAFWVRNGQTYLNVAGTIYVTGEARGQLLAQ